MPPNGKRILWAIDILSPNPALERIMASLLDIWEKATSQRFEPIYLMNPQQLRIPSDYFESRISEVRSYLESKMQERLSKLKIAIVPKPILIHSKNESLRLMAGDLLSYARRTGSDLSRLRADPK